MDTKKSLVRPKNTIWRYVLWDSEKSGIKNVTKFFFVSTDDDK